MQYALAADPGGSATQLEAASIDPVAPTDDSGNTYVFVGRTYVSVAMYIASNISLHTGVTQPTITCALQTGLSGVTCGTIAVGGLATASVVDSVSSYVQRTGVTTVTTPSIVGSVSPEFFVAFAGLFNLTGNSTSSCSGTTFTNYDVGNHDGIGGYPPAYFTSSSSGTYCANLSQNASGDAWPIVASFKGAGAVANNATTHGGKMVMGGKFITQ
jgi:hypothetical protein